MDIIFIILFSAFTASSIGLIGLFLHDLLKRR